MKHAAARGLFSLVLALCGTLAWAGPAMRVEATARQSDGRIVFASETAASPDGYPRILVGRLNADGTTDTSFATSGLLTFDTGTTSDLSVNAIAAAPDGHVIVGLQYAGSRPALLRLDASGAIAPGGFGNLLPGFAVDDWNITFKTRGLLVQADGSVIAAGADTYNSYPKAALVRYGPDGTRDATFGNNGMIVPNPGFSRFNAIAPWTGGGWVAAGYAESYPRMMIVACFDAQGQLDTTFHGSGYTSVDDGEALGVYTVPGTTVLLVGGDSYQVDSRAASRFVIAKLDGTGQLDPSFGNGYDAVHQALYLDAAGDASAVATSVYPAANGDWIAGGTITRASDGQSYFAAVRFPARLSYNGTATWITAGPRTAGSDTLAGLYGDANGHAVAVGTRDVGGTDNSLRVRYLEDTGAVDTAFVPDPNSTTPDSYAFVPVTGATGSTDYTSGPVTITGLGLAAPIGVDGGSYSVGCAEPFTTAPGTITNGQVVCVRATSSATERTPISATLSIGGVQAPFTVTTGGIPDTVITSAPPDPSGANGYIYYDSDAASGAATAFECRFDADPFVNCQIGVDQWISFRLAPGIHTFDVRAINTWGTDPTPATYTWTVAPPPVVSITSSPAAVTNQTSATFAFTSSDSTAQFQCSLNGAPPAACTSPKTYSGLAAGSYRFSVYEFGNLGTSDTVTVSWTIDLTPPDTKITSWPLAVTNSTSATFVFSSPETGAAFECSLDGAAWIGCSSPYTTAVAEGNHSMAVRAKDSAGNTDPTPASVSWTVDLTPPDTTLTSGPAGIVSTRTVTWTYASSEGGTSFDCAVSGGPFSGGFFACNGGTYTLNNLADGSYSFQARARDAAGNVDPTPAVQSFTVDGPVPDTILVSGPSGIVSSTIAQFQVRSDQAGASFECSLDGAAYGTCPFQYTGLAQGDHTFRARAYIGSDYDPTPVQVTWTVDTIAPDTAIASGPSNDSSSTTVTFALTSTESPALFDCSIDGGAWAACATPATFSGLAASQSHSLQARARDLANNVDPTPATWSWTIDPASLDTAITSGPAGTVAQLQATFAFRSPDADASFECSLDGAAFSACSSPKTYPGLADGPHTFQARARNAAGAVDASPATATWIVDTVAPDTTFTSQPYPITQSSNATFDIAASESGTTLACHLDGAPVANCAPHMSFINLLEGSHTFDAAAVDAAGNVDASPATFTWTIDFSYGPETAITSGPSGVVATTSATFTFDSPSGTPAVSYRCAFDGTAFPCTSPWSVSGLSDGQHGFVVYAIDATGNVDRTPASVYWTVDTSVPDTLITSSPSGTVATGTATFQFGSTEPTATFECSLDALAWSACVPGATWYNLVDGMHLFEVRARDLAGNVDATPASVSWSVDTTAPNTSIVSGPAVITNSTSATFAFGASESSTFACSLDGAAPSACTSPVTYAPLAGGSHAFSVDATDGAGNADGSPAAWSWVIDLTEPDTTITSGPSGPVNQTSATFAFTSTESGATFECRLDNAAFAACTSPVSYASVAAGAHTFQARAIDPAGNVDSSPASSTWTVDTTPPDTTITGGPSGNNNPNTATFTFTATESPATFECKLDGAAFAACASPVTYASLVKGSHTFQVRARDAAGNVDATPASRTWMSK